MKILGTTPHGAYDKLPLNQPVDAGDGKKIVRLPKNIVLCIVSDSTGCGFIRCILPFNYLNSIYGKSHRFNPIITPILIKEPGILMRTRSILFQRQMLPEQVMHVKQYKKLQKEFQGFKMIYDIDDLLWGKNELNGGDKFHGIPSYNFASAKISTEMKESSLEIMSMMDLITVSTEYLKNILIEKMKIQVPIEVLPNSIPQYLYGANCRLPIKEDIKKPIILYNGSPTHYCNENKMKGDFDNAWCDWIIKSVKENKINFYYMGGLPFFFEEIKDKIQGVDWISMYQYALQMEQINPHFIISPLVKNEFNSCKSDIKFIESAAIGAVHVGTIFRDDQSSPYDNNLVKVYEDATMDQIDEIMHGLYDRDTFNNLIKNQYKMVEDNGRFTESKQFISRMIKIF